MLRVCVSVCLFAVLAGVGSTSANAQTFDQRTYFTFNQPVALPGVTLPPGKYLFRLADPMSGRRVVQVMDAEGRRTYALLMSMPTFGLQPASAPDLRFMETREGARPAVKQWWYPGQSIGREFLYSKEQERKLAGLAAEHADAPLPATPMATVLGAATLMAGFAESMGPKMRP
jgi:hypothetical protein